VPFGDQLGSKLTSDDDIGTLVQVAFAIEQQDGRHAEARPPRALTGHSGKGPGR
jgi:hypothetical protein